MNRSLAVIVPNYNNGKYLNKCIDSILNQTYLPDEIIIVDDCSTDNSIEIIKSYESKSSLIKGIYLSKNRGVSNARHVGILNSKSRYITSIDSDDYYYSKNKLEKEMELIIYYKKKYNKDVVSYSKVVKVKEDGSLLHENSKKYYYFEGKVLFKFLCGLKNGYLPRDYCYLKEIYLESGGYDVNFSLYEDLDLLIRISNKLEFYPTKNIGTAYRVTNVGLSSKSEEKHAIAKKIIYKKNTRLLPLYKRYFCIVLRYMLRTKNLVFGRK